MLKLRLLRAQVSSVRQFEEALSSVRVGPAGTGKSSLGQQRFPHWGAPIPLGEGGNGRESRLCPERTYIGKGGFGRQDRGGRVLSTPVGSLLATRLWADG